MAPLLFSGSSHPKLAQEVCRRLGISVGKMSLNQFPDGETHVQLLEDVRGRDVYVLQSIAKEPNHYLFELLIIIDALKRSSARSITAIIPYLGYCRQDRKDHPGAPITAKLVANVLTASGMTRLVTFDLHADQIEGFFDTLVDHFHCQKILGEAAIKDVQEKFVVVAPDIGGVKLAENMAKILDTEIVVIDKKRLNSFDVTMTLIGDVRKKDVLIVDDLCSTGGTLVAAANLCKKKGAGKIIAAVSHALFVGDALKKIEASPLESIFTTDTIHISATHSPLIQVVSVAPLIANAILIPNEINKMTK